MVPNYSIIDRTPTGEEYARLIQAVGWRSREPEAIEIALRNSYFSVCAISNDVVIGFGRVIGDGGLHFYLTDIVVKPEFQRRGIGTAIVAALMRWVEGFPFSNTVVAVLPTGGLRSFYERQGFKAHSVNSPQMSRWIKPKAA
jgi:GNAT superfamily N-acetyltransferase